MFKPPGFKSAIKRLDSASSKWAAPIAFLSAVLVALIVGIPTSFDIYRSWSRLDDKDRAKTGIELIQLLATITGGVAIFWNIAIARKQLETVQEQGITDRFFKAVEQLGSEQLSVRVGAIYSLGRIASDSPRDNKNVMEVLSVFVREKRGLPPGERLSSSRLSLDRDVQAAIIVIGRRNCPEQDRFQPLFLSHTDLRKVSFANDNYSHVRFHCSDFREANFYSANLQYAEFWRSTLSNCTFIKADLQNADLVRADFKGTNMKDCLLLGADIDKADFRGACNLSAEQLRMAKNWEKGIYDESIKNQLFDN